MLKLFTVILSVSLTSSLYANIKIGQLPPHVVLQGEEGSKVDGKPFDTKEIKGKVFSLFYVDPDQKDDNPDLEKALKEANFDKAKYGSIAVINLAATWKPNFVIESILEGKQKDYPDTIYVKDKSSFFVKNWNLTDNAYVVMLFDREGKCLYRKAGKLDDEEIKSYIKLISDHIE